MADFDLDCRGLTCPEPVMRTRRALTEGRESLDVLVDNETARDNVERFARSYGYEVGISPVEGGFLLSLERSIGADSAEMPAVGETCPPDTAAVILITSDRIGSGEPELGATLMKSFMYACAEADQAPAGMVFMNSGVRLVTETEETVAHVRRLEERGVDVLVCGTCLDYYGLTDRLCAGRVSNMYEIQAVLIGAGKLVSL